MEEKKSLVCELIQLSLVDGHISDEESALIKAMGNMMGLSDEEILNLFKNPVDFQPAKDHLERITHFHSLVLLSLVDRDFKEEEKEYLMLCGLKMGLNAQAIKEVLTKMFDYPNNVIPPDELIKIFKKYMN